MGLLDGRKRTAMYFGNASPTGFLEWYLEAKNKLAIDGLDVTHLGFGTLEKPSIRITQAKRTENRYIESYNNDPTKARSWELYCIDRDEKYLSNQYRLLMSISTTQPSNRIRICAMVSFDFSLLEQLDFSSYTQIMKNYIDWEKEVIFDCGKHDIPFNYGISQNPKVFEKIKIISEKAN